MVEESTEAVGADLIVAAMFEKLKGRTRCRYYCAYLNQDNGSIAGYVAGYVGGGSFEGEQFYGVISNDEFASLCIDSVDVISGQEVEGFYENCNWQAHDLFVSFLVEEAWDDYFVMYLDEENIQKITELNKILMTKKGDMVFFKKGDANQNIIRKLFKSIGLTAGPIVD